MNSEQKMTNFGSEKPGIAIWIILGGAILLRWLHLAIVANTDLVRIPIIDSAFYHVWATQISKGDFLGGSIYFMSPLYPHVMGLIYALIGAAPWKMLLIQGLFGVMTVWFVYKLASRMVSNRIGLISAAITAVYAPFIYYDSVLLTSSLIILLSSIILYFGWLAVNERNTTYLLLTGLFIGLSALARPLVMVFLPFYFGALYLAEKSTAIKNFALVVLGTGVILLPIAIRNSIVGNEFVLTTSSAGMNFYVGNNPEATGLYWEAPFLSSAEPQFENEDYRRVASENTGKELTTRDAGRYWQKESMKWIFAKPFDYIALELRKLYYFLNQAEFANNASIHLAGDLSPLVGFNPIGFWIIAPLGLAGLIRLYKRYGWQRTQILHLWVLAYLAGCLVFFVSSEYRLPIVLGLIIGTAFLISEISDYFKQSKREEAFRLVILGLVFLPLVNFRTDFVHSGQNARMDWFNVGNTLLKNGKYEEAIPRFEHALKIDPYFAEGMLKLAEAYYRSGDIDKALEIGKQTGLHDPETVLKIIRGEAIHEAYALLYEGEFRAAMREFLFAGWDTSAAEAETTRVGRILRAQQAYSIMDFKSALENYRLVFENDTTVDPVITYNLAYVHWQLGYPDSAEFYTGVVLKYDSLNVPAIQMMARIYNASGRTDLAEQLLQRIDKESSAKKQMLNWVRVEMDSLIVLKEWEEALAAYGRYGSKYYPETEPQDNLRLGRLQLELGDNLDLALRLLEEAETGGVNDVDLYVHKGRVLNKLGRYTDAASDLQKAISLKPNNVIPHIVLAETFLKLGELEKANRELETLIRFDILDEYWKDQFLKVRAEIQKR